MLVWVSSYDVELMTTSHAHTKRLRNAKRPASPLKKGTAWLLRKRIQMAIMQLNQVTWSYICLRAPAQRCVDLRHGKFTLRLMMIMYPTGRSSFQASVKYHVGKGTCRLIIHVMFREHLSKILFRIKLCLNTSSFVTTEELSFYILQPCV